MTVNAARLNSVTRARTVRDAAMADAPVVPSLSRECSSLFVIFHHHLPRLLKGGMRCREANSSLLLLQVSDDRVCMSRRYLDPRHGSILRLPLRYDSGDEDRIEPPRAGLANLCNCGASQKFFDRT